MDLDCFLELKLVLCTIFVLKSITKLIKHLSLCSVYFYLNLEHLNYFCVLIKNTLIGVEIILSRVIA